MALHQLFQDIWTIFGIVRKHPHAFDKTKGHHNSQTLDLDVFFYINKRTDQIQLFTDAE